MRAPKSDRIAQHGVALAMGAFEALGFAFRVQHDEDYGGDAHAELIEDERPTGRLLGIQLKSGPSYFKESQGDSYVFRVDSQHVEYWFDHCLPVLICLCDVDAGQVYWQAVDAETATSTGKGFKILIPMSQKLDSNSEANLRNLLTPMVAGNRYTIFEQSDVSHGSAKRYSFKVVINGAANKLEIASIVRQVTVDGAKRVYNRNHLAEGHWGDSEAQVVWIFIYPSAEDHARNNHICRSLWTHPDLPVKDRPLSQPGENIGDDIIVHWNQMHPELAHFVSSNASTKGGYLSRVPQLVEELSSLLTTIEAHLSALFRGSTSEESFLTKTERARARIVEIEDEVFDMPLAPFECNQVDQVFKTLLAYCSNIALFYSERGRETWKDLNRRGWLVTQQLEAARESLGRVESEISRIR